MPQRIDRTGQKYGYLVALYDTGKRTKHGRRIWAARCTVVREGMECGRVIETYRLGSTLESCGCIRRPKVGLSKTTEYKTWLKRARSGWPDFQEFLRAMGGRPEGYRLGKLDRSKPYGPGNSVWVSPHGHASGSKSPTYVSWRKMMIRCYNPRHRNYLAYGGKGIKVCDRWQDFLNFLADMGPRTAGTTLGRILDMGDYEPGNVFWMTPAEQGLAQRNKRALLKWQSLREASLRKPPVSVGLEQIAIA